MKPRIPLSAQILLWFFLNLLLLGVIFYIFFRFQFRIGLESLLAGQAGERIEAVSNLIASELREAPPATWTTILERYNAAYKMQFSIFLQNGAQQAGEPVVIPGQVLRRMREFAPAPRPGPPPARGFMPPPLDGQPPEHELAPPPRDDDGMRVRDASPRRPHPKFMVRTSHPVRYWVGVRMPGAEPMRPERSLLLLAVSETLSGGGLFIDFTPWVVVGFGAMLISVLFWWPMIRGITRSVSQITQATEQVAEGKFDIRVDESRQDELGRLGQAINRMTLRIAGFVTGQKRFLGDVAHELCSPLARMQMALGILEQRSDDKQSAALDDFREELQEMSQLVNELLSFSRAGLREREIHLQPVALAEIVRRVVAREAAADGVVSIEVPDDMYVLAEPSLLARALANLVRNAIRYARGTGPVRVSAALDGDDVAIRVADCGPGVPEAQLGQIFDPFFRLESSRSRETGGVGLGLAIVRTCVQACGGTVTARKRNPTGLEVEIRLHR